MIIYFLIFIIIFYGGYIENKYNKLNYEVKEHRKINRKLNKWRYSHSKIIDILDNGKYRLRRLRVKK
jgi:hypothetical protein